MNVNLSSRQTQTQIIKKTWQVNTKRRAWLGVFLFSGFFWSALSFSLITF